MLRGIGHLSKCLQARPEIANEILWPIEKQKLAFGLPFKEILKAFEMIERNDIEQSVGELARHEQINILQAAIYGDVAMRRALDANQFSWATSFPSGVAADIHLTLSAECKAQSNALNVWFSKTKTAKLYDQDQRMVLVNQAATRFNSLLKGSTAGSVEASINQIAAAGGAR